jgi:hypothetical protein
MWNAATQLLGVFKMLATTICLIHLLSEGATLSQTALAAGGLAQDVGTAGAQDDALHKKYKR